ncbi:LuxR C-terminal-related transcriptional regulator [Actinoplanes sp. CA-030573]|uniref:LuxR C-terminal-related transcriptional regulator n=1 Tax=Actinoplanes sp. CA-030573 TaxID=3239898 RepID=UPI003D8FBC5B
MDPQAGHDPAERGVAPAAPPFELLEAKIEPPADRAGTVTRTALLDRLDAVSDVPVIAVAAPPGYGKTTLLAQWVKRRGPRAAWFSCDDDDNDPAVLLTCLGAALGRVDPGASAAFDTVASSTLGVAAMFELTTALSALGPFSIAIDSAEAITDPESRRVLAEFALTLPSGWQLAIASRNAPPLPLGRLRAGGRIVEIGAAELAMDPDEAGQLIAGAAVDLPAIGVEDLIARTEGWAAGLYFAALSIRAGTPHRAAGFALAQTETLMLDYLRFELLDRVSPAEASFLVRTSVLDRMTGSLCDAVLEAAGSAGVLDDLAARNMLVIPVDRNRHWYRYHHLLRRLLGTELRRREPESVPPLHLRAARWLRCHGLPEAAIRHAQAAGDADLVAELVLEAIQPVWASGRVETVLRWMEWLDERRAVERYPAIAVHGALILALLGRAREADRWVAVAERGEKSGVLADGSTMESVLAYLRALLGRDGVEAMRRDARESSAGLGPDSPYRVTTTLYVGISHLLENDLDRADPILASAFDDALAAGSPPVAALVLAERCIPAAARGDLAAVEALSARALAIVEDGHFEGYWSSALIFAQAGLAAALRGDRAAARRHLVRATHLRPLLTYALPVVSVQTLLQMARAYLTLADADGADAVLRQAAEIRRRRPDLGDLGAQADELRSELGGLPLAGHGASSLTADELRLLPLLATHLSLGEIALQLHTAPATVQTRAWSIYRKLGVADRDAAVARAGELGM